MNLAKKNILGLTIDERAISVAQVVLGRRSRIERLAQFDFSTELSLDQPQAVGLALRTFLSANHLTCHHVRLGVPARWVIAQEKELPPSDATTAASVLRMQAERLAVQDMVFDVAGPLASSAPNRVLLVGIQQKQLDRVQAICDAAGLRLISVEPMAMAVARQVKTQANEPVVVMGERGGELVWQHDGVPFLLRHMVGAGDGERGVAAMGDEIRRTLMMRPSSIAQPSSMLLWTRRAGSDSSLDALSAETGLRIRAVDESSWLSAEMDSAALNGQAEHHTAGDFLPAVAVALSTISPAAQTPVNFIKPRLAPPKPRRFSRTMVLASVAVLIVVLGLLALYLDVRAKESQVATLEAKIDTMQPTVKAAQQRLTRFGYGRTYFDHRTPVLDCLLDVSGAFGRDSSIWATGFSLSENRKGTLAGKAANQPAVLALRDRLEKDRNFSNLQLLDLREGTGNSRDVSFSMSFIYVGGARDQ